MADNLTDYEIEKLWDSVSRVRLNGGPEHGSVIKLRHVPLSGCYIQVLHVHEASAYLYSLHIENGLMEVYHKKTFKNIPYEKWEKESALISLGRLAT